MPTRRAVLGACAAACTTAGCLWSTRGPGIEMRAVTDRELIEFVRHPIPPDNRSIVRAAIENGSTTAVDPAGGLRTEDVIEGPDGAFYEITKEAVREVEREVFSVKFEHPPGGAGDRPIAYEELPPIDRQLVELAFFPEHEELASESDDPVEAYAHHALTRSEAESSVLATGQHDAVVYEGDTYGLTVESERDTVTMYRFTATKLAPDWQSYAALLKERYKFELDGLSEDERKIIETAIDGRYEEDDGEDEAFESIERRLRRHEPLPSGTDGVRRLAEYEGTCYLVQYNESSQS